MKCCHLALYKIMIMISQISLIFNMSIYNTMLLINRKIGKNKNDPNIQWFVKKKELSFT